MSIENLAKSLGNYFKQPDQIPNVGHLKDDELNAVTRKFNQGEKERAFNRAKATSGTSPITAFLEEYIKQLEIVRRDEKPWSAARVNAEESKQDKRRWMMGGLVGFNSAGPLTRSGKHRGGKRNPPE